MSHIPSLPVELLISICEFLRPQTPAISHDAAWNDPLHLHNWWDRSPTSTVKKDTRVMYHFKASYAPLLALRKVNRKFNAICTPILYYDFSHLGHGRQDEHITAEVISRYHSHFRTVRIIATPSGGSDEWQRMYQLLLSHLGRAVTALGVYFDNSGSLENGDWNDFSTKIVASLEMGSITSFGIYSNTTFWRYIEGFAPYGATNLLGRTLSSDVALNHIDSLDISIDTMETRHYDALRAKMAHMRSVTIRAALCRNLSRLWDKDQQNLWFRCNNLTSLQLIHCKTACAPHIPPILRFFPSLRVLFLSGCGDVDDFIPPPRTRGWSFKKDTLWGNRPPLDSLHLEYAIDWEILALGVIHTKTLIITAMTQGDVIDSFTDEEIFPCLHLVKTECKYVNSTMETVCAKRGITIETEAKPLVFWDD